MEVPRDHPLVAALAEGQRLASGREPFVGGWGRLGNVGDGNILHAAGVPTVQYGPGDIRIYQEWPTPDERVSLSDLVTAARALAYATYRLCGLVLIFVFSLQLGWFPATGQGGLSRLVLPAATIGLNYSAVIARLVRSSLLEVLGNHYIATARAKGLGEWLVVLKHALGNALVPVTPIIGVQLGNLLAGTIIVETVFSRQGMGRLAVTAVLDKDYPLIQGVVLVSALGYVLVNLLVDLSYSVLDPRIRHRETAEA